MVVSVEDRIEGSGHDVAIGLADRCDGYAAILADRLNIDGLAGAAVGLQIPGDCGVPQGMPDNLLSRVACCKSRLLDNRFPAIPTAGDRLAVKLNDRMLADAEALPAAHVREQGEAGSERLAAACW